MVILRRLGRKVLILAILAAALAAGAPVPADECPSVECVAICSTPPPCSYCTDVCDWFISPACYSAYGSPCCPDLYQDCLSCCFSCCAI